MESIILPTNALRTGPAPKSGSASAGQGPIANLAAKVCCRLRHLKLGLYACHSERARQAVLKTSVQCSRVLMSQTESGSSHEVMHAHVPRLKSTHLCIACTKHTAHSTAQHHAAPVPVGCCCCALCLPVPQFYRQFPIPAREACPQQRWCVHARPRVRLISHGRDAGATGAGRARIGQRGCGGMQGPKRTGKYRPICFQSAGAARQGRGRACQALALVTKATLR